MKKFRNFHRKIFNYISVSCKHIKHIYNVYLYICRDCFKEMFNASIELLDFASQPEEARSQINKFVEDATKDNIKDLIPPGSIGTDTNVVLANAAFFKGNWASKFDKEDTEKKIFYEHSRMPVYVDMMRQRGNFNYGMA